MTIELPIVAVTVFPDRARVTRRGTLRLAAGEHRLACGPLPLGLERDSVRVAGRGPASVLGVDVSTWRRPAVADATVAALEDELRGFESELAALADDDEVGQARERFLDRLAIRSAGAMAASELAEVSRFADGLDGQRAAVRAAARERDLRREELSKQRDAVQRRLADLRGRRAPDQLVAQVQLDVTEDAEIELELSYVTPGAGWSSSYDLRLAGERLTLTWFGLVSQHTGEDWPQCLLKLSTARPAAALAVPELDPWYLSRWVPPPPPSMPVAAAPKMEVMADSGFGAPAGAMPRMARAAMVTERVAEVEQGTTAATYTPSRPVAVPSDGTSHRTVVASLDLSVQLDYVSAPARAAEATLRATVRNNSPHTLPAGRAALFHEGEFVGATGLPVWAPEEERELALGVDDRVRVERELVRRTATKATLGSTRRTDLEYEIRIANHGPRPIRVTVLDQLPVSTDDQIVVKEAVAKPEPVERTDLGVLRWQRELDSGAEFKIQFGMRVETGKGVKLSDPLLD